ncbi:MAG: hypothetical protein VX000_18295, partial [Myxococcota bacterium]|nr:hypothetical protein [Myxococcota bacterium]
PSVAVALSPSSGATRSDTLECTATTADEDGDSVVVSYSWTVDGVAETASGTTATASRLAGVFQKDQLVTCTATADDAKGGTASAVASTTIGNTPPTVSTPSLTPAIAYTNDTITANVTTSDDDGDSVGLSYDWMVDGVSVQTGSDNTLDGTTWFDKGQDVRVTVTADDGDDTTDAASPTRTVANTPPAAPVVAIDPADPVEGEDLYCAVTTASTDADGDTVTYRMGWTVDAVAYSSALTTTWADDTADGLDTRAGEVWECTATPTDGDDDGGTASDAVRVEADTCEVGGSWSSSTLVGGRETQGYRVYDINGDGHDDLAFNNQLDQNIDFYMGDGSGTYTGFSDYHVGRSGGGFDFGDVDNDGDL